MPNAVTSPNLTSIFEWCVINCSFNNKHKSDICFIMIGLSVQHLLTVLDLIGSIIGETYMIIWSTVRMFTLTKNKIFTWTPKIMRKMSTWRLGFLIILHYLVANFISYKKLVQKVKVSVGGPHTLAKWGSPGQLKVQKS